MRVRMKTDVSGSRDGQPWPRRGETFEVSDAEGADLCASGMAEPVTDKDGDVEKRVLTTENGPVGDAYLPKDGGQDPVVQGQKDAAMAAASPENTDVAARADDQHPPHEATQEAVSNPAPAQKKAPAKRAPAKPQNDKA